MRRTPALVLMVAAFTITSAAQAIKYHYEYKCPETVIVARCRNDGADKVPEDQNFCHVDYPDRPMGPAKITVFDAVLQSELAGKLRSCKGPAASDPAIAKAIASKVDTQVFGIQLGDPLDLPACPMFGGMSSPTCFISLDETRALMQILGSVETIPANRKLITLAASKCPSWVKDCRLFVETFSGKVGMIGVFTKGPAVDLAVRQALAEKYGQWSLSEGATVTPESTGRRPFRVTQYWWNLPGIYVYYQPVWSQEDGATPDIREGLITIESETGRKARVAAEAKIPKPKM